MRLFESMRQSAKHSIFIRFSVLILSLMLIISISLAFFVQKKLASIIEASTKDNTASNRMIQSLSLYNPNLTINMESGTPLLSDEKNKDWHGILFLIDVIILFTVWVAVYAYWIKPLNQFKNLSTI